MTKILDRCLTDIDNFAEKFIDELPPSERVYVGELNYVTIAARQVHLKLVQFYSGTGVEPPSRSAIRLWFYRGTPPWAIAVLTNIVNEKVTA